MSLTAHFKLNNKLLTIWNAWFFFLKGKKNTGHSLSCYFGESYRVTNSLQQKYITVLCVGKLDALFYFVYSAFNRIRYPWPNRHQSRVSILPQLLTTELSWKHPAKVLGKAPAHYSWQIASPLSSCHESATVVDGRVQC